MARVTLEPHRFETGDFALVSEHYPYLSDDGISLSLFHPILDVVTIISRSPGHLALICCVGDLLLSSPQCVVATLRFSQFFLCPSQKITKPMTPEQTNSNPCPYWLRRFSYTSQTYGGTKLQSARSLLFFISYNSSNK